MPSCIQFQNISKRYQLGNSVPSLRTLFRRRVPDYHWALKDVNFELKPGEALGVIGPNGAGKTTILKILSRVTFPSSGNLYVDGRLSALIELGAGFHPDLSGRDNVYLNGTILGMQRHEIKERFDQIVDFAGVASFIDTPVKRYSSGMYARLGFAIAAHVDPQILVVDEVLAVGDYAFQMKCHARMDELRKNGTSLIFVSHNMEAVRRVCDRGLVMYRGESIFQGTAAEAVVAYSDAIRQAARDAQSDVPADGGLSQRVMTFEAEIEKVSLLNAEGEPTNVLRSGTTAVVAVDVCFHKQVQQPIFGLTVRAPNGQRIYDTTTRWQKVQTPTFAAGTRYRIEYRLNVPLLGGLYELGVDAAAADLSCYYDRLERALSFNVVSPEKYETKGLVDLKAKITFKEL